MRFSRLTLSLAALLLAQPVLVRGQDDPAPPANPLIVGGQPVADIADTPWQVALVAGGEERNQFCGGSLVATTWVLTAAHCVDVDAEEIGLLAGSGVGVAHCPRSNGYLGCGVAPLEELLAAGIPVGIATDSPASTPSFDLFEEARTAIVAARARAGRPDALSAARALGANSAASGASAAVRSVVRTAREERVTEPPRLRRR